MNGKFSRFCKYDDRSMVNFTDDRLKTVYSQSPWFLLNFRVGSVGFSFSVFLSGLWTEPWRWEHEDWSVISVYLYSLFLEVFISVSVCWRVKERECSVLRPDVWTENVPQPSLWGLWPRPPLCVSLGGGRLISLRWKFSPLISHFCFFFSASCRSQTVTSDLYSRASPTVYLCCPSGTRLIQVYSFYND